MENNEPRDTSQYSQKSSFNKYLDSTLRFGLVVWRGFVRLWKWTSYAIGSIFLAILVVAIIFGLVGGSGTGAALANEQYLFGDGVDKVAVIPIEGIIGEAGSSVLGGGVGVSADSFQADLLQAQNDPLVKAVVLSINSPGGSAVISDQIYQYIIDFKAESKKPVIASFGDTAASGGYYIAAATDKIVANPASLTGSIGVILEYYDASGLMQKVGVSPEVVKSGTYKDIGSLTRPTTAEERAILQSVVDEAYGQFVNRVVDGRKMERDKVVTLADGRIYTGSQAKENGLVDELGNLDTSVDLAMDFAGIDEASVVKYIHGGWWDSVLGVSQSLQPLSALNRIVPSSSMTSGLQYRWVP